ncbi:hypothetical protein K1719_003328 [Acacia pycnantha]|nr:hypothetical protein K1719_003328 [Acacia pycnantha]
MAIVLSSKATAQVSSSREEDDLIQRSSKKSKNNEDKFAEEWPTLGDARKNKWIAAPSFAEKLQGISSQGEKNGVAVSDHEMSDDSISDGEDSEPLCVITEHPEKNFPTFAFSSRMKKQSCGRGRGTQGAGDKSGEGSILCASKANEANVRDQEVWKVVQKPKRQKQGSKEQLIGHVKQCNNGSRFTALAVDHTVVRVPEASPVEKLKLVGESSGTGRSDTAGGRTEQVKRSEAKSDKQKGSARRVGKEKSTISEIEKEVAANTSLRKEKRVRDRGLKSGVMLREEKPVYEVEENMSGAGESSNGMEIVPMGPDTAGLSNKDQLAQVRHTGEERLATGLNGKFWADSSWIESDAEMVPESPLEGVIGSIGLAQSGAGSKQLFRNIQLVCQRSNPSLLALSETKCETDSKFMCLNKLGFDGLELVPSLGQSGGLVVVWKSSEIAVTVCGSGRQFMHLRCDCGGNVIFFLSVIYAVPCTVQKRILWEELERFASAVVEPWAVLGDFNDILFSSEKLGGSVWMIVE